MIPGSNWSQTMTIHTKRRARGRRSPSSTARKVFLGILLVIGAVLTASGVQHYSLPVEGRALARKAAAAVPRIGVTEPDGELVIVRVRRVIDGDTLLVEAGGIEERVRLLNVNAPESVHHDVKQNTQLGREAAEFTRSRLLDAQVRLEANRVEGYDKYGRRLAYILVDGENFNIELVRKGYSEYITKYGRSDRYDAEFRRAEAEASRKGLGIWAARKLAGRSNETTLFATPPILGNK